MKHTPYLRPKTLTEAKALLHQHPEAQALAGGQSLLAAMKLGLTRPSHLVDLQDLPELRHIEIRDQYLWIGAMVTHASVACSATARAWSPMLVSLASNIADPQIRQVGTMGGSLANNDPAACWPAGILAFNATVVTAAREIKADDFFVDLFTTALEPGEVILGVKFPEISSAHYLKYEQPASRFALVGVAVTRTRTSSNGHNVRVAVTGLGHGVKRWDEAEQALTAQWTVSSLDGLHDSNTNRQTSIQALSDLHASSDYRMHLMAVLCRRAVAYQTGESARLPHQQSKALNPATLSKPTPFTGLRGEYFLKHDINYVWQSLLDPNILQVCIPGCSAMRLLSPNRYQATVRIGLGPISAKFETAVELIPKAPPNECQLNVSGKAGSLGSGQAHVQVRLESVNLGTQLTWQAQTQLQGTLAQLGNRLVQASAQRLSEQFFIRFSAALSNTLLGESPRVNSLFFFYALRQMLRHWWQYFFRK